MKLKLRDCVPDDVLRCPNCGTAEMMGLIADNTIGLGDGFNPPLELEGEGTAAGCGEYVFLPKLLLWDCKECDGKSISISVTLSKCRGVTGDWVGTYLAEGRAIASGNTMMCASTSDPQYPRQWLVRIAFENDVLIAEHMFGPYLAVPDLANEGTEIKRDSGAEAWFDAAMLVARMWPILSGMSIKKIQLPEQQSLRAPDTHTVLH